MSDLVETLRQWARDFSSDSDCDLFIEAADEIERLRSTATGEALHQWRVKWQIEHDRAKTAEAELDALRNQLVNAKKSLNEIAPAVENLACHQEQCDIDGIIVKVSRQAVDEVVNMVNHIAVTLIDDQQSGVHFPGRDPTAGEII